jgi:hypothetical protein
MNRLPPALALATVAALCASPAAAQTTFTACRVPNVGAIYMIGVTGAPTACLDASHVEFSWTEGGAPADGSITTAKLADGAVTSAKIATDAVDAAAIATGAVGSAEILNGSIATADIADGTIAAADMGFNWITTPPSGTTVRGQYGVDFTAAAANSRGVGMFSWGFSLPSSPIVHFIPEGGAAPGGCSGNLAAPGADPGHLCVFESPGSAGNATTVCIVAVHIGYTCGQAAPYGAGVFASATAAGIVNSVGTWALTVP